MLRPEYISLEGFAGALEESPLRVFSALGLPALPPLQRIRGLHVSHATAGDLLFGTASSPESEGSIEARARMLYEETFRLLDGSGHRHAIRFWNQISAINDAEQGVERYRLFNIGRNAAFEAAGRLYADSIPAATAVGAEAGKDLTIHFVASRRQGVPIENPRQVRAWQYPGQYGPKSPTFARAAAYPAGAPAVLFVSGTASIVGHRTMHAGDIVAQTRETLANLEAVFAEANRHAHFPMREAFFKAYVRHEADLRAVQAELSAALGPAAHITYLKADICRADLLVEVEAFSKAG